MGSLLLSNIYAQEVRLKCDHEPSVYSYNFICNTIFINIKELSLFEQFECRNSRVAEFLFCEVS